MPPLRELLSLSPTDRRLVFTTMVLVLFTRVILFTKWFTLRQLNHLLYTIASCFPFSEREATPEQLCWAVNVTAEYLPGNIVCLPRALVSQALLRSYGFDATMRIGVAPRETSHKIDAHAWVEYNDTILIGDLPDIERFSAFQISDL